MSRQGHEYHVELRQGTTLLPQLDVGRAVEPCRFGIERPQSDVAKQLRQSATIVVWFRGLLDPDFQLTDNGMARNESMAGPASPMHSVAHPRYLAQCRGEMVAVEQVVRHQASPICRRTCSLASRCALCNARSSCSSSSLSFEGAEGCQDGEIVVDLLSLAFRHHLPSRPGAADRPANRPERFERMDFTVTDNSPHGLPLVPHDWSRAKGRSFSLTTQQRRRKFGTRLRGYSPAAGVSPDVALHGCDLSSVNHFTHHSHGWCCKVSTLDPFRADRRRSSARFQVF